MWKEFISTIVNLTNQKSQIKRLKHESSVFNIMFSDCSIVDKLKAKLVKSILMKLNFSILVPKTAAAANRSLLLEMGAI